VGVERFWAEGDGQDRSRRTYPARSRTIIDKEPCLSSFVKTTDEGMADAKYGEDLVKGVCCLSSELVRAL